MAEFKNITTTELHPTFGAEVSGIVDYENLTEEQLEDLRGAIGKVRTHSQFEFKPLSPQFHPIYYTIYNPPLLFPP